MYGGETVRKKRLQDFMMMNLGVILLTLGVYFFKIPNRFSTGGVSGAGTILGNVTPLTPGTWIAIINMLLLIFGFMIFGIDIND